MTDVEPPASSGAEVDALDRELLEAWKAGDARRVVEVLARKYHSTELMTEDDYAESIRHIEKCFRMAPRPDLAEPGSLYRISGDAGAEKSEAG